MRRRGGTRIRTAVFWAIVLAGLSVGSPIVVGGSHSGFGVASHPEAAAGTSSLDRSQVASRPQVSMSSSGPEAVPVGLGDPPYWLGGHVTPIAPPAGAAPSAPAPANVDPTAYYSAEPAPVGVGDFGIGATGAAYTYYTPAFRANAYITSYSTTANLGGYTSNASTFQLNVVVVLARGSSLAEYWIQDVPILNSSSRFIQIENNVWNFSGVGAQLPSNSIRGNGSVYTSGSGSSAQQYYADGVGSGYPGADTTLSFPANLTTEVIASNISGTTHVGFEYNDGFGWVTYDNVTFPWTHGWTLRGFEVTGSAYNPAGLFDDAEWIVGGPGGGSSMVVQRSNVTMTLEEFNGHNFEAVPNAFDFGSDTAESAADVVPSLPGGAAPGLPSEQMKAGSGSLRFLYGSGNVSTLNVSAPIDNGTLLPGTPPTGYRGHTANLTLLPGSYELGVENASSIVATKNVTLGAGEYLPVTFARFAVAPGRSMSQQPVTAEGTGYFASSTVSVLWPGNSTPQCQATAAHNGSFSCDFDIPLVPAETYNLTASDNASSGDVAYSILVVTTNLTVAAATSATATDLGGSLRFWANETGGFPPYSSFVWNFGNGDETHTTVGTVNYTYPKAGNFTLSVTVRDRIGDAVSASVAVRVRPDPAVTVPEANRTSADVGQSVGFSVVPSNGLGPYSYAWAGLPPGCLELGASATCANLTGAGTYSVSVNLTDSQGFETTGRPIPFVVYPDPVIANFTNLRPFLDVGQNLTLQANASLGSGGFTYAWSGLPVGCSPNAGQVSCPVGSPQDLLVGVLATDSNGVAARSPELAVTASPDPTVRVVSSPGASSDLGQPTGLIAEESGGSGLITYRWSGLPTGCTSANVSALPCAPTQPGTFDVAVSVVDQSRTFASANLSYTVYPFPTVRWVYASETSGDVGRPITLEVAVDGGDGPYRYAWSNLPVGCTNEDSALLQCTPAGPGSFPVAVNATDANNATASTPTTVEAIAARPAIVSFTASPAQVVAGYPMTLNAHLSGGTGTYTYEWFALPVGCAPHNLSTFTCRPTSSGSFPISVVATDGTGVSANATLRVTVVAAVLGLAPDEGYAAIVLGLAGLGVVVVLAVRWVRRSGGRRNPKPPEPDA